MSTSTLGLGQPARAPASPDTVEEHTQQQRAPDFDTVYDEQFDFVWRTAHGMGVPASSVDDVTQEVFVVVHRRLGDFDARACVFPTRDNRALDPSAAMRRWILGIVVRIVADHRRTVRRKDSRCVPHELDRDGCETTPSLRPAPSEEAEQAEALRLVLALLEELEPERREVLVLSQIEEMSVPEIAACLGLNVNTTYARLRAARRDFDAAHARYRARTERRVP